MLKFFQTLFARDRGEGRGGVRPFAKQEPAPDDVVVDGASSFPISRHLIVPNGFPILDQEAIERWLQTIPEAMKQRAWETCERAWLLHLRQAMGAAFRL